jgi:predicted ribosomally synthesized peptide with nif11-like leader
MSKQAVINFVEKVEATEALRTQLNELNLGVNWVPGTLKMAQEMGFDFTAEELTAYVTEKYGEKLSDDMLDKVAGGSSNSPRNW